MERKAARRVRALGGSDRSVVHDGVRTLGLDLEFKIAATALCFIAIGCHHSSQLVGKWTAADLEKPGTMALTEDGKISQVLVVPPAKTGYTVTLSGTYREEDNHLRLKFNEVSVHWPAQDPAVESMMADKIRAKWTGIEVNITVSWSGSNRVTLTGKDGGASTYVRQ
jgi:hypothetical protein